MTKKNPKTTKPKVCEFGGDAFKDLLLTLGCLSDECCLKVSKTGITTSLVDPAHIAMMMADAPASVFDDFKVSEDMEIGIDIPKVLKAIKRCSYGTRYSIKDRQVIVSNASKRFTLSTIDTTGMSDPKQPDLKDKLCAEFSLTGHELQEISTDAAWISDHISIEAKGGIVHARCEGTMDSYEKRIGEFVTGDARSQFPLEYVQKFAKVVNGKLTMSIGPDNPMRVTWNTDSFLYDGTSTNAHKTKPGMQFVFLLAPRIESEPLESATHSEAETVESQDEIEEQEAEQEALIEAE